MRALVILLMAMTAHADKLVYRMIDHAGEARVEGADLAAAYQKLDWPAKMPSPYSGLHGEEAYRVLELALTDADVEHFGTPHAADTRSVKLDEVWNRTRAVYQSKSALFAPPGSKWSFEIPSGTHFRGAMASLAPTELIVEVDGKERLRRKIESNVWIDFALALENAHTIRLINAGTGAAFWGDPLLFQKNEQSGPNLLLVIIDTLRADAIGPRLREMPGAHFDRAITAATWTRPSLLALLGGDLPSALGQSAEEMIPPNAARRRFYSVAPPLLPRILEEKGWQADAIGNNFFLLGYPQIGLSLGFESVADVRHPVLDTPAIERAAERYLEAHRSESFYLQVHFDGPHWPYTPPAEYLKKVKIPAGFPEDSMARAYLGESLYADEYLGKLLDALTRLHLDENTVVVVIGDHGEIFDHAHDHFVEALGQPTLHHHGWSAYDEILRVPLVISLPKGVPNAHIDQLVSLVDVKDTLLELLGQGAGKRSLVPLMKGGRREEIALTEGQNVRALRSDGWLYLRRTDPRVKVGEEERKISEELYDLAKDPLQHHSLDDGAQLARWRAEMDRLAPKPPPAPVGKIHLRLAPGHKLVEGIIHCEGQISGAQQIDPHTLKISVKDQIDFTIDPPDSPITLELTRDGVRLEAKDLMVGRFGLPLLSSTRITQWSWLDSARPPVDGDRGDVLLWRDPTRGAEVPALEARANDEVAGMMQRWGYSQPSATPKNAREH
jgi:arylsulfatase A-like enzyme